nr:unnamed protein product [Trypanosoma congolense IL3000]
MLRLLAKHAPEMGEVTCHNDLLSANIMRHKGSGALKIIDFEYAKRNYFLFDIANHLNEYAGLECDYGTHFPCDDHIKAFIVCYLRAMRYHLHLYSDEAQLRGLTNIIPGQQHYFMFDVSVDEESQRVGRMLQQVKLLTLASHLSWSIWALLQEAVSTINMDFLQYSKLRLARYFETKEEFGLREI